VRIHAAIGFFQEHVARIAPDRGVVPGAAVTVSVSEGEHAWHGRRVRRNFLRLLKGRAASALLMLASTALMARSLSPADFGLVVLIHSYLLLVRGLVNLKPFEAIIHYGVPLLERKDSDRLVQLLRLTFALDALLAVIGMGLAMLVLVLASDVLPWDSNARQVALVYCLLLPAAASGAASGVLRLYNRFDLLGIRQALGPLAQLCGVTLAWWADGSHVHFLMAFGAGFLIEHVAMLGFGYSELRRQQPRFRLRGECLTAWRERFPGLWRYLHVVYWQSNIDLVPKQISLLLVGSILGPAAAGLFRIAQQIARVISVPALLLRQVLFPDLARLWFRRDPQFRRLLGRTLQIALATGLSVALMSLWVSETLIEGLAGGGYAGARDILPWLLLAAGLDLGVATLRAAGYAMGQAGGLLRVSAIATVCYLLALVMFGRMMGLGGVAFAVVVWASMNLIAFAAIVHGSLGRSGM